MKNRIRDIRKEQNITLSELAKKAGISSGYLCHLEKGSRNNPSLEVMDKIAKALNKSIADVFLLQL